MFPPFALIPRCLEKIRQEGVTTVLIAPVRPNQVWFPQLLQSFSNYLILLPYTQDILTNPDGHSHLLVVQGHLPLATWLVSDAPGSLRGFQTQLSWSSGDPGGILQNKPIQALGTYGNAGVLNRMSIPFQLLSEFILSQFEAGKQYRIINTIRSAISMTHKEIDGTPVRQHPLVSRFLKGVFNSHPPAPKYATTWDVDIVLSHIKGMEDKSSYLSNY